MYGKGMGKCKTCIHPIENHCADDQWCPKCNEVGHDIELNDELKNTELVDGWFGKLNKYKSKLSCDWICPKCKLFNSKTIDRCCFCNTSAQQGVP